MTINNDKTFVSDLQIGMYICKLDRPWLETPFPFQGFYIRTMGELNEVKRFCEYVYISDEKSMQSFSEPQPLHAINKQSPLLAKEKEQKTEKIAGKNPKYLK